MSMDRPNPEELLEALHKEEMKKANGKLKVFLGLAAGVGKTFAMLEEAQTLQADGVDIVVGIVETHDREETKALLKGLKIVPLKKIIYKGKEFTELDVEAIIALNPEVVLVDELAHNNIPGSKHLKRWQDVLEILEAGINVYTTINVQHIESLNDIIRGVTEVSVRETVPDHVIDRAASIRVVDLTPDELLKRLKEGRVYFDEQSKAASLNFFQKDKLTALRELALRYAADKIDYDLRQMALDEEKKFDRKPRETFLTAISSNPHSQKLIRMTKRHSASLDAPWIALYVDDGSELSDKKKDQLARNFALARDLGAEVISIKDPQISNGIKRIVKQKGVTQIIVGRPTKNFFLKYIKGSSLFDQLINECEEADIHIIKEETPPPNPERGFLFSHQWYLYFLILSISSFIALLNWIFLPYIEYKFVGAIFLITTFIYTFFFKIGPIFISSLFFTLTWIYFFIPPTPSFVINSEENIALVILYLISTIAISLLVTREKEHRKLLEKSEESISTLYEMVNQIAIAGSTESVLKFLSERFNRILNGVTEFAIKSLEDGIELDKLKLVTNSKEQNAALWSFNNGKEAGFSTDTLPLAENLYIPLKGYREVMGILIFRPHKKQALSSEEKNVIYTVCRQLSYYIERSHEREKSYHYQNLLQIQKIQKMILDRFSYAFQWPLETIQIALKTLKKYLTKDEKKKFFHEIYQMESSLEVFTKNLNNISTIKELTEGMTPLKKTLESVAEIIQDCCSPTYNHPIKITLQENLPAILCDSYLIHILLNNLIVNATEYSPIGTTIEVEAKKENEYLHISVSDKGKGIPEEYLTTIFDKFSRVPGEPLPRIGLGLAIAKTIAELHEGHMKAENRAEGGARFSLYIPYT